MNIGVHIQRLAVAYHAYCTDVKNHDDNGTIVWGKLLLEAQEKTAVVLIHADHIERSIRFARVREGK